MRSVLLLALLSIAPLLAADPPSAMPKLAILRFQEIMRTSKLCSSPLEAVRKIKAEAEAKLAEMDQEIKSLDNAIQALNPKSDRFGEIQEKAQVARFRQKQYFERMKGDIDRKAMDSLRGAFAGVRVHLKDFCKQRGVLMVAQVTQPELEDATMQQAELQLGLHAVLYADDSLDITDAFLAYSNQRFAAEGPPALPSAPAPAPAPGPAAPVAAPAPAAPAGEGAPK
ncbi:hypothetical protein LBMAG53_10470 [Planctomycetota bacterium]|nr:hypothetical protein LBMAG53_10470 [Planctomycetota bacterium]